MATESFPDYAVTSSYTDIVATVAGIASIDTLIQNRSFHNISIVGQATGSAPTGEAGIMLTPGAGVVVNAAQVWAKAYGPDGTVSLSTTDGVSP